MAVLAAYDFVDLCPWKSVQVYTIGAPLVEPPLWHQGCSKGLYVVTSFSRSRAAEVVGGDPALCIQSVTVVHSHFWLMSGLSAVSCPIHVQSCVWLLPPHMCTLKSSSHSCKCAVIEEVCVLDLRCKKECLRNSSD